MQGAHVEGGTAFGAQIDGATGVGGHGVEVTGMKMQRLPFTCCRTIRDVAALQAGLRQNVVIDLFRQLQGIALAQAFDPLDKALFGTALNIEECDLGRAGSDIDSCRDSHE